ncbi:MAG: class B sortase [Merdibacter sp.]
MKPTMTAKRKISTAVIAVLLSALLVVSGVMIYRELHTQQKEKEDFRELAEMVAPESDTETEPETQRESEASETAEPEEALRDLSGLFAENSECIGWLCIPGTEIDYPVMHTPDVPQKYLRRNFYGEYSQSGVPFLDFRCDPNGGNLLIYGHNMKNGTMFSDLKKYLDAAFLESHPTVELQTADGLRCYTVSEVKTTDTSDEWYRDAGANLFGDKDFLALSTCYGSGRNGRLLVIAVQDN